MKIMLLLSLIIFTTASHAIKQQRQLTKAQWQQDVNFLLTKINLLHPKPWISISEKKFRKKLFEVVDYSSKEPRKHSVARLMAVMSIMTNQGRDAETGLWPLQKASGFHVYPLQLFLFKDGIFIVGADDFNKDLRGHRLTAIAGIPVKRVISKIKPYVNQANPIYSRNISLLFTMIPEIIESAGISRGLTVTLTTKNKEGKSLEKQVRAISTELYQELFPDSVMKRFLSFNAGSLEYFQQTIHEGIGFKQNNHTALYLQYSSMPAEGLDEQQYSFHDFINRVEIEIRKYQLANLIIDIRNNSGNSTFEKDKGSYLPLLKMINDVKLRQHDFDTFVLIGRETLSDTLNLVIDLDNKTNAVTVGEHTGGSVNQFGYPRSITLPNSKLSIDIATKFTNRLAADGKNISFEPDYLVEMTSAQYFSKKDIAFEKVLQLIELSTIN